MNNDPLSLDWSLEVWNALNLDTAGDDPACDCRLCKRRRLWAAEAGRRADVAGRGDDVRAQLARDLAR